MSALLPGLDALAQLQSALLHSLWQGGVLAVVLYALLRGISARRTRLRYGLSLAALGALLLAVLFTWGVLAYEPARSEVAPAQIAREVAAMAAGASASPVMPRPEVAAESPAASGGLRVDPRVVLALWLLGVALMLVRAWRLHAGADGLCRASTPVADARVLALVAALREELRIARPIAVRAGEALTSPAVAGLLSPTLLIPLHLMTGLPPDHLRAVIAHELAHIRRYDYLVNFAQYIVEALLYFNPAVWWISRQVRIEREACCDAVAVAVTGEATAYAEALSGFGGGLRTAAQSADGGASSGLADRVRRVLVPGYRPRLRWQALLLAMGMSGLTLAVLGTGSFVLAGWVMSDAERVAAIAQALETHASPYDNSDYETLPKATISGTIRSYSGALIKDVNDDADLPKCHLTANISRGNHYISRGFTQRDGHFRTKITAGRVNILARMDGYAPVIVGPFKIEPGEVRDDIEIVLPEAIPTYIQFVDASGNAVTDVTVGGFYKVTDSTGTSGFGGTFGADGRFTFAQSADPIALTIRVESEGFAPEERRDLMILPGDTYTWVLRESTPVVGRIIDEATGAPIAGAQISRIAVVQPTWIDEEEGATLLATTDAAGAFRLTDLNPGKGHIFQVRARGYGTDYLVHTVGTSDVGDFPMGPRRDIRGTVTGDRSRLVKDYKSGRPVIQGGIQIGHHLLLRFRAFVKEDGGFTFRDVPRGTFKLYSNALSESLQVSESVDDLALTVPALLPTREVVLRLLPPKDAPAPTGEMEIFTLNPDTQSYLHPAMYPIVDGLVHLSVPVPSTIQIGFHGIPGYYPALTDSPARDYIDIPAGTTALTLEIPLSRAGAIYGELFGPDGAPFAGDFHARIKIDPQNASGMNRLPEASDHHNEDNRFVCAPLPLGYRYRVNIRAGLTWAKSDWITLDARAPIENIQMHLPPLVDVPVRIVDPKGDPVGGAALGLFCDGNGFSSFVTDGNGRFVFEGINPDYAPEYWVRVDPVASLAGTHATLKLDGTENVVQLQEGVVLRGVVVEEGTGQGVAGVRVHAQPDDFDSFDPLQSTTDVRGAFEFTVQDAARYRFYAESREMVYGATGEAPQATGGQEEPVIITVRR